MKFRNGSLRLFRAAGIDVYVHWSWALVAFFQISSRLDEYNSPIWKVAEYVTLFGIVLLHEFGHALACRSVGGSANQIMLWPLGGVAYVNPPPRPGPVLWSIAAGPLVNVALLPVTLAAYWWSRHAGWDVRLPDLHQFLYMMAIINAGLLIFNLLPVYPLDGGQILQALLWFIIGRAHSLLVVSIIGLIGGFGLGGLALFAGNWWLVILAAFVAFRAVAGFREARTLIRMLDLPRHKELTCPSCGSHPLRGNYWQCDYCGTLFDTFACGARCPGCGSRFDETACPDCRHRHAMVEWFPAVTANEGDYY